ncbi:hypothetical protein CRE_04428 [Caenorhabditis remanei]|uniref:CCHC-type domain-containing protein n=1 Tax=Caenorhabditis remanei TaxID=31234 RepID=E3NQA7_CAERE|nr:hypothetical protein CRE_04428 [Caenorhabditis remanei]
MPASRSSSSSSTGTVRSSSSGKAENSTTASTTSEASKVKTTGQQVKSQSDRGQRVIGNRQSGVGASSTKTIQSIKSRLYDILNELDDAEQQEIRQERINYLRKKKTHADVKEPAAPEEKTPDANNTGAASSRLQGRVEHPKAAHPVRPAHKVKRHAFVGGCIYCRKAGHAAEYCTIYRSVQARLDICRKRKYCVLCLYSNHQLDTCRSKKSKFACPYCSAYHHKSLCETRHGRMQSKVQKAVEQKQK